MNDLQIFKNNEFGEVRVLEKNGEPWLVGKDVAEALEYSEPHKAIVRHVDLEDRTKHPILSEGGLQESWVINESGLYSLILGSKLPSAKKFKKWVTSDVLPSIRKHGAYMTSETLEKTLQDPDFIIRLATQLKEEQIARKQAENLVEYKNEVINGMVDDIDILTKRNVLNRVVRHKGVDFKQRWSELYKVFRETHSIDLKARCEGHNKKQTKKKDELSVIKYAEAFGHLDNLYKIAVRLYESDINKILDELRRDKL
jgi:prophage antirepressor-like protein